MRSFWLVTVASLALAGCGQATGDGAATEYSDGVAQVNLATPAAPAAPGAAAAAADAAPSTATATAPDVAAPRIAYVYRYALEVPTSRAAALMARHEQACTSAGAAVCQVIGSENARLGRDYLNARLDIRATPAFIARFRSGWPTTRAKPAAG